MDVALRQTRGYQEVWSTESGVGYWVECEHGHLSLSEFLVKPKDMDPTHKDVDGDPSGIRIENPMPRLDMSLLLRS